jgi:hypothetical protein
MYKLKFNNFLPHLNNHSYFYQLYYAVFITCLQIIFIDQINQGITKFDILTPWIVCIIITHRIYLTVILTCVISLALEAHCNLPKCQMLTCYWSLTCCINLVYPHLSWNNPFSWAITASISQLYIIFIEYMTLFIKFDNSALLTYEYLSAAIVRIILSFILALIIGSRAQTITLKEKICS